MFGNNKKKSTKEIISNLKYGSVINNENLTEENLGFKFKERTTKRFIKFVKGYFLKHLDNPDKLNNWPEFY